MTVASPRAALVSAAAVAVIAVAGFPRSYFAYGVGADESYRFALNRLAVEPPPVWEVAFNYGPLGFLAVPMDIGANLALGCGAQILVHTLLIASLATALGRSGTPASAVGLAACALAALGLGVAFEYRLLLALALSLYLSLGVGRGRTPFATAGGALAGASLFIKFSAGVAAVVMLALAEALRVATADRRARWRTHGVAIGGFLAVVAAVVAVWFGGSPAALLRWLGWSWEAATGYSVAMSSAGSAASLACGQAALAVAALLLMRWWRTGSPLGSRGLLFIVPLALSYKHGFVRAHNLHCFGFALLVAGVLPVLAPRVRDRRIAGFAAATLAAVSLLGVATSNVGFGAGFWRRASALDGVAAVAELVRIDATRRELAERGARALASNRLAPDWIAYIKRHGGAVDVLPSDLSKLANSGLTWTPNPVLQTYSAYTERLDARTGGHFLAEGRPAHVILELPTINPRDPMLDAPATARALLTGYRPIAVDRATARVLLSRRDPGPAVEVAVGRATMQLGEWTPVPAPPPDRAASGVVLAHVRMRLSIAGRIEKAVLRVPPVAAEFRFADGAVVARRMIPSTMTNGMLASAVPRSVDAAVELLCGTPPAVPVVAFRVGGPGALRYDPAAEVRWTYLPLTAQAGCPGPG